MNWQLNDIKWKPHLLRLNILALSTLYLIAASYIRSEKLHSSELARTQTAHQQMLNRTSADAQRIFNLYYPDFVKYSETGRIGMPNRLNWIETLNSVAHGIGVPNIHFNLDKTQVSQEGETPFFHNDLPIYVTNMYIDLKLLHEGDLFNLLNNYANLVEGSYNIEACELRSSSESTTDSFLEGLQGKCHLRWFNLYDLRQEWSSESLNEV